MTEEELSTTPGCVTCHGARFRLMYLVNGYQIVRCSACGTAQAWPRPTQRELIEFYTENYFAGGADGVGYDDYQRLAEFNAKLQWRLLLRYLRNDLVVNANSVLDVGCATGGFLAEAKADGWQAHGTELSASAASRAREHFGLSVDDGVLVPHLPSRQFDLVTMWHVLEHLIDPIEALASLVPHVTPLSGVFFAEMPNWSSLGRRVRGAEWSQLRPPEHINFFTEKSLATIAQKAGFSAVRVHSIYPRTPLRHVPQTQRPKVLFKGAVGSIVSTARMGGYLRLVARTS